ncbi:MAG: RNA 3'-terminal phosphate cyclase [Fimbriimonadaceae bacterium]
MSLVVLDGTYGEGGGSLIRTALAMSAITQQPVRVSSVRGNLKAQGLQPEDLTILNAFKQSTHAETAGAEFGSTEFSFLPSRAPIAQNSSLKVPEGMDGLSHANCNIVLNTLLPVLARTGAYSELSVEGETYGHGALGFDSFCGPTLTVYRRMGIYAVADQLEAGFGRHSRGQVHCEVEPSAFNGLEWNTRGELRRVNAIFAIGDLPESIAQRGVGYLKRLNQGLGLDLEIEVLNLKYKTQGLNLTIWAEFESGVGGTQSSGARGLRVETVVQTAFEEFKKFYQSEATLDEFLADQVILAAALAESPSSFRVSRLSARLLTSIWVIKQFLPIHITVKGKQDQAGLVTVKR